MSLAIADPYESPLQLIVADGVSCDYKPFDFAMCFLVLTFLPADMRASFMRRLRGLTKPGGAMVVVDKVQMPPGYIGTAFSRLTLQHRLAVGAKPDEILRKELSMVHYQRPLRSTGDAQGGADLLQSQRVCGLDYRSDRNVDRND